MADDPKAGTTGTPAPDGGNAGTGAAPPADGAEGGSKPDEKVTVPAHEYHALQGVAEEKNALAERLARAEAELAARTQPPTAGAVEADDYRRSIQERESYLARLRVAAQAGNEDAKALIAVHESAQMAEQRTLYALEMAQVPEADRAAVKKLMAETGAPGPAVAHRLLRSDQFETVAQENTRLKAELEAAKRPKIVPEDTRLKSDVVTRPGASSGVEEIAPDEYTRRMMTNPAQTIADRKARKFKIKL